MAKSRTTIRRRFASIKLLVFASLIGGLGFLLLSETPALFRTAGSPVPVLYKTGLTTAPTSASLAEELQCLALNIYFEARSEPKIGKLAVGHVVMNRVRDGRFPQTVCDVVRQGDEAVKHKCQFSWWCDGRSDNPDDQRAWDSSNKLAELVYWDRTEDPTNGALWYHADYVEPRWSASFEPVRKLGRHLFYLPGPAGRE